MNIMTIDRIDDFEKRIERQDAFWDRELIDRPVLSLVIPHNEPRFYRKPETVEQEWLEIEYAVQKHIYETDRREYMGDSLPLVFPDLGPDLLASLYGGELIFMETTSYLQPFLKDWNALKDLEINRESLYFRKMEELYTALLEAGKNRFYIGWPDLHPGADCLVGFRGPEALCMDLYDNPAEVKSAAGKITSGFLTLYDHYYEKLTGYKQPCCGWPGIVSGRKWHVPSNDFSYMISEDQYQDFFLEKLIEEISHMDASIYHLDGPGSLKHLDTLLDIQELDAIQWVYGAGNGKASDHIPVYRKIQQAGKGIQILHMKPEEMEVIMENLSPEGVWIQAEVSNREEAEYLIRKAERWACTKQ